ncbi:DUF1738 domain-containing protein [Skermania sp. ID1734]|uniref:ArdC family protein n=1 Tax=Skermania sp. ID1734 TaxID=2597516 RepID=UPI00117E92C8|nr:ArdC family protein [Skermania sp. ID1734]TSD93758.1 DUF1738 domain-containing protein [Skermania sp. ID1734]
MTRTESLTDQQRQRRAAARELQAAQLREELQTKVAELANSETWLQFLQFSARGFHTYSLSNLLLILSQHPTATQVAGYRQWQARGRQVRKGEKAIKIYGYSTKKITDTDESTGQETTRTLAHYPILSVFAHDQTDPIPDHPAAAADHPAQRLTGEDTHGIYTRISTVLGERGWTVTRQPIPGAANGYTTLDGTRRVVVDTALSAVMAAKTGLHEAAHVVLHAEHDPDDTTAAAAISHAGIRETEAESVAYILAGLLGLDTSAYSVGYIAEWAEADTDLIRSTATRVLAAVRELVDALDHTEHPATSEPADTA